MANRLNDIVNVTIDIGASAIDSTGFDHLLIVGLPPVVTPDVPLPTVGVYTDLSEVEEAGYTTTGENADPVGIAARIAFAQNPKPDKIYIAAQKENAGGPESPVDTLNAALATEGWYGICAAGVPQSDWEAIADWTEAQTKIFGYTFLSKTDPLEAVYYRSFGVCGLITDNGSADDTPAANAYLHVAMMAKCLSHPAGAETWAFKQLAAVYPSELSGTLEKALTDGNSNYFTRRAGRNITRNGKVRAGEWIDIIRGRDWLQNDMQLRLFNLMLVNPKIPFTNKGIIMAQNEMIAGLKTAQERGIVAENEYDEDGNLVPGFTTSVPNAQSITATQKASRILTDCKFTARLSGAIHTMDVNGTLTY